MNPDVNPNLGALTMETQTYRRRPRAGSGLILASLLFMAGCATTAPLPQPRSVITVTGERLTASPQSMADVNEWLRTQMIDIERNPSFLIRVIQEASTHYPWSTLELTGDTAQITVQQGQGDPETPFLLYAHFRLMAERGPEALEPWLPEAHDATGFALERAILERIADVWLLGRSVFDTSPFGPLDEILFSREAGYLDEFIYAAQPDRFAAEAEAHLEANPEREASFRTWFARVFEREGPGFVREAPDGAPATVSTPGGAPEPTTSF
jgi:hypothetical protein